MSCASEFIHHIHTFVCLNPIPTHFICCCLVSVSSETNCFLCTFHMPPMILQSFIRSFCLISFMGWTLLVYLSRHRSLWFPMSFFPIHSSLFFWMLNIPSFTKNCMHIFTKLNVLYRIFSKTSLGICFSNNAALR